MEGREEVEEVVEGEEEEEEEEEEEVGFPVVVGLPDVLLPLEEEEECLEGGGFKAFFL